MPTKDDLYAQLRKKYGIEEPLDNSLPRYETEKEQEEALARQSEALSQPVKQPMTELEVARASQAANSQMVAEAPEAEELPSEEQPAEEAEQPEEPEAEEPPNQEPKDQNSYPSMGDLSNWKPTRYDELYADLSKKYMGQHEQDAADLKEAQGKRDVQNMWANVSEGLIDMASGGKSDSKGFADNLRKQANLPVEDVEARRKQRAENLGVQDKLLSVVEKVAKQAREDELDDPNNPMVKTMNALIESELSKSNPALLESMRKQGTWPMKTLRPMKDFVTQSDAMQKREFDRQKLAQEKELKLAELAAKKTPEREAEEFEIKEDIKEKHTIKRENRKERKNMDQAEAALNKQLDNLRDVKKKYEEYLKGTWMGTGPVATLGGLTAKTGLVTKDEQMEAVFKQLAMTNLVDTFKGMSKAIDSNVERQAWEATQPSVAKNEETNLDMLERAIAAAESVKKKTQEAKARYDRTGEFSESETETESVDTRRRRYEELKKRKQSKEKANIAEGQ